MKSTSFDFLILIDDNVFLQHVIGLAYILATQTKYTVEIVIADNIDQSLLSYQILKKIELQNHCIALSKAPSQKKYDKIFSQWGPPPSFVRQFSKIRQNVLAFKFNKLQGKWICLPHGFEIKINSLNITNKGRLRSFITHLSFNSYKDYEFYTKYCFDSKVHSLRYGNLLKNIDLAFIGSLTFNKEVLNELKSFIAPIRSYKKIVIMPKMRHVDQMEKVFSDLSSELMFVPHPREYDAQIDLLKQYGISDENIIHSLDLLKISDGTDVYDYGTSVSYIAKVSNSKLYFKNFTKNELIIDPNDINKVDQILNGNKNEHQSYKNFILNELVEI